MGLIDALNTREGIFALGLLQAAAPRPVRPSLGGGLLAALQGAQSWQNETEDRAAAAEERKRRDEMRALQMQQLQAAAEDQRRQRDQQRTDDALLRQQFAPLPGPTQDGGVLMPRADPAGMLAQGASPQAATQLLALQQAMQKPGAAPVKLAPGEQMFDPTTGKPLFGVPATPREAAPTELSRLLSEMQHLPPGSPARALYEQQLRKLTTHAPAQTTISLGAPVPIMLPDGSQGLVQPTNRPGELPQVLRDPVTGLPLRAPAPRLQQVPASANAAIAGNRTAVAKIDEAIRAIDANPGALGAKNYIPDPVIQRADPAGVATRAQVADIGSLKLHDRSGAVITAAEFPRLRPFIPQVTDDPKVAAAKLRALKREYELLLNEARETYTEANGYRPPPVFSAPLRENAARAAPGGLPSADAIEAELRRRAGGN